MCKLSLMPRPMALSSASALDVATVDCVLLLNARGTPTIDVTVPDVDFRDSPSLSHSRC